jgi:hypothetical protein
MTVRTTTAAKWGEEMQNTTMTRSLLIQSERMTLTNSRMMILLDKDTPTAITMDKLPTLPTDKVTSDRTTSADSGITSREATPVSARIIDIKEIRGATIGIKETKGGTIAFHPITGGKDRGTDRGGARKEAFRGIAKNHQRGNSPNRT